MTPVVKIGTVTQLGRYSFRVDKVTWTLTKDGIEERYHGQMFKDGSHYAWANVSPIVLLTKTK